MSFEYVQSTRRIVVIFHFQISHLHVDSVSKLSLVIEQHNNFRFGLRFFSDLKYIF